MPTPKQIRLAREIASALGDDESLASHLEFAEKYSEDFLRRQLQRALSTPEDQIRRSRGALFTFLVRQNHGKGASRD